MPSYYNSNMNYITFNLAAMKKDKNYKNYKEIITRKRIIIDMPQMSCYLCLKHFNTAKKVTYL